MTSVTFLIPAENAVFVMDNFDGIAWPVTFVPGSVVNITNTVQLDATLNVETDPDNPPEFSLIGDVQLEFDDTSTFRMQTRPGEELVVEGNLTVVPPPGFCGTPLEFCEPVQIETPAPVPVTFTSCLCLENCVDDFNVQLINDPLNDFEVEGDLVITPAAAIPVCAPTTEPITVEFQDSTCLKLAPDGGSLPVQVDGGINVPSGLVDIVLDSTTSNVILKTPDGVSLTNCDNDALEIFAPSSDSLQFSSTLLGPDKISYACTFPLDGTSDSVRVLFELNTTLGEVEKFDLCQLSVEIVSIGDTILFTDSIIVNGQFQDFEYDTGLFYPRQSSDVEFAFNPLDLPSFQLNTFVPVNPITSGFFKFIITPADISVISDVTTVYPRSTDSCDQTAIQQNGIQFEFSNEPVNLIFSPDTVLNLASTEPIDLSVSLTGCVNLSGCESEPISIVGDFAVDGSFTSPALINYVESDRQCIVDSTTCNATGSGFVKVIQVKESETEDKGIFIKPEISFDGSTQRTFPIAIHRISWREDGTDVRYSVLINGAQNSVLSGLRLTFDELIDLVGVNGVTTSDGSVRTLVWDVKARNGHPLVLSNAALDNVSVTLERTSSQFGVDVNSSVIVSGVVLTDTCQPGNFTDSGCGCSTEGVCNDISTSDICFYMSSDISTCSNCGLFKFFANDTSPSETTLIDPTLMQILALETHPCTGSIWALGSESFGNFSLWSFSDPAFPNGKKLADLVWPFRYGVPFKGSTDIAFRSDGTLFICYQVIIDTDSSDLTSRFYVSTEPILSDEIPGGVVTVRSVGDLTSDQPNKTFSIGITFGLNDTLIIARQTDTTSGVIRLAVVDQPSYFELEPVVEVQGIVGNFVDALTFSRCNKNLYVLSVGELTASLSTSIISVIDTNFDLDRVYAEYTFVGSTASGLCVFPNPRIYPNGGQFADASKSFNILNNPLPPVFNVKLINNSAPEFSIFVDSGSFPLSELQVVWTIETTTGPYAGMTEPVGFINSIEGFTTDVVDNFTNMVTTYSLTHTFSGTTRYAKIVFDAMDFCDSPNATNITIAFTSPNRSSPPNLVIPSYIC